MPQLSGKVKEVYIKAYGQARYNQYSDSPDAKVFHGGGARRGRWREVDEIAMAMPFKHRWEYGAESIFWTMYSALLRVYPRHAEEVPIANVALRAAWERLETHTFPDADEAPSFKDGRQILLDENEATFIRPFLPAMKDVALMLHRIAEHVSPTYAVMDPLPPFDNHLHEAIQRLILEYLVTHKQQPIPLNSGVLRSVRKETD